MISADSQAMGRCGENFTRAFQMAHLGKERRGKLPEEKLSQSSGNYGPGRRADHGRAPERKGAAAFAAAAAAAHPGA